MMTDAQLYLLLKSMIDELDSAIVKAYELMPEDAEREQTYARRIKAEWQDKVTPFTWMNSDAIEDYAIPGNFIALGSLSALSEKWTIRAKMLLSDSDRDGTD